MEFLFVVFGIKTVEYLSLIKEYSVWFALSLYRTRFSSLGFSLLVRAM